VGFRVSNAPKMPRKKTQKKQKKVPAIRRVGRPQAMSEYLWLLEESLPLLFTLTTHLMSIRGSKGADQNYWLNKKTESFAKKIVDATLDYVTKNLGQFNEIEENKLKDSLLQFYKSEKKLLGQHGQPTPEKVAELLIKNRLPTSPDNINTIRSCFTNGPGLSNSKAAGYGTGVAETAMYVASILKRNRKDKRAKYNLHSSENIKNISRDLAEFLILLDPPKAPSYLDAKYRLLSLLGVPEKAIELTKEADKLGREAFIRDFLKYHQDKK